MNCKLGDLAIMICAHDFHEIGKIVEIIGQYNNISLQGNFCEWHIKCSNGLEAVCRDAWLRPISGLPMEDTIEDEQPVTA